MGLIERLSRLSSCQVSDGLGKVGLPQSGLVGIHGLEPVLRFAGPAMTVRFESGADPTRRVEYFDSVQPGDVIVLANNGRLDCSAWGGHRSLTAMHLRAAGSVIDGAYRDVKDHRERGYPVYGRASTVASSSANGGVVPVAVNETVTIGGVDVAPGDYLVGDESGVVVVPRGSADAVVVAAEAVAAKEEETEHRYAETGKPPFGSR